VVGATEAESLAGEQGSVNDTPGRAVSRDVDLRSQVALVQDEGDAKESERCGDGEVDVRHPGDLDDIEAMGEVEAPRQSCGHRPRVGVLPQEAQPTFSLGGGRVVQNPDAFQAAIVRVAATDDGHVVAVGEQRRCLFAKTVVTGQ